jgi:DNA-binding protein H-NS
MPRGNPKTLKNFRLTEEAIELLEQLSSERGISQAAVIEQAVRDFAHESGTESGLAPAEASSEESGESGDSRDSKNSRNSKRSA